ncbi:hypothetical protein NDU88_003005 [Pleurodeles waltl]|uniref:Uncharacterized protein n=1 Tax=Pleurodeles waltl TaxID=8319 RepID=A0AAV7UB70_PLEWA|nr:hypothetical protein NDU88_003005 [Pleurodeles waltl]
MRPWYQQELSVGDNYMALPTPSSGPRRGALERTRKSRPHAMRRFIDLAFVLCKSRIATTWKSPAPPDLLQWLRDLLIRAQAEAHHIRGLWDRGIICKDGDCLDPRVLNIEAKNDLHPP